MDARWKVSPRKGVQKLGQGGGLGRITGGEGSTDAIPFPP